MNSRVLNQPRTLLTRPCLFSLRAHKLRIVVKFRISSFHFSMNFQRMILAVTLLFCDSCFLLASFIVDMARFKWTGISAVEVNIENERITVACSRCENLKFRNFTLSFSSSRQRIVLKCMPHVQHDYFSSFNQSDIGFK